MSKFNLEYRLDFISGLHDVVLKEISSKSSLDVIRSDKTSAYITFCDSFKDLIALKSVAHAFLVMRGKNLNPRYIANHKSLIGYLIEMILKKSPDAFKTFNITCAGQTSPEVREIVGYIRSACTMIECEEADLKIHIAKMGINVQGCRRAPRIRALHREIIRLAGSQKCRVALISGKKLRNLLLGNTKGTKHDMAETLAKKFPAIAAKLPPKRRAWDSEDGRMDMFDAVGLAVRQSQPLLEAS